MISIRIFLLCLCFGILPATVWYKSLAIGSNDDSDVIHWKPLRSQIECAISCKIEMLCESFLYDKASDNCTLLSVSTQIGHFNSSENISHFSNSFLRGCPVGYDLMRTSNTCLRLYSDYLTWNDSRIACLNDGAQLPVLDSDILFSDFTYYMDNVTSAAYRVAVDGFLYNNTPYWSTGELVDRGKFCIVQPDLMNQTQVCLFHTDSSETWCNSFTNRLDDSYCSYQSYRICMKKL